MTLCLLFSDHKSELDMICICMNLWGVAVLELDKINGSAILKKKISTYMHRNKIFLPSPKEI